TDFDVYDPKSWRKDALLQPATRDAYGRLLAQGWTDALRARHPQERIYTFWDYFRNHWTRNAGLRIDHLLLSKQLAPRLLEADVDRWCAANPVPAHTPPTWSASGCDKQATPMPPRWWTGGEARSTTTRRPAPLRTPSPAR